MIVRDLDTAAREGRMIKDPGGNWDSTRLLLKDDNMGFSFHITTIYAGADSACTTRTTSSRCIASRRG